MCYSIVRLIIIPHNHPGRVNGCGGGGWASGPVGLFCIHICIGRTACELVGCTLFITLLQEVTHRMMTSLSVSGEIILTSKSLLKSPGAI